MALVLTIYSLLSIVFVASASYCLIRIGNYFGRKK